VQQRLMADGHVSSDMRRKAFVGVYHRAILHIAAVTDHDPVVISADHRAKPDTGVDAEAHRANDVGTGGHVAAQPQFRRAPTNRIKHAADIKPHRLITAT